MNSDIILNFIRGIPLFNGLSPVYLTRLSQKAVSLKFDKGKIVLEEGKHCNNLFIPASGKLEAYTKFDDDNDIILNTLGPGEIFGEAYVLDGSPVDMGLRASENSAVICIDRMTVMTLIKENPEFCKGYLKQLSSLTRAYAVKENVFLRALIISGMDIPETYSIKKSSKDSPVLAQEKEVSGVDGNEDIGEESEGEDGVFFRKEFTCPFCRNRFGTLKPRQKYIITERTDGDFCMHYKTVNPLYYEINVCPKCGYSFNNSTSSPVNVDIKDSLAKVLAEIWVPTNYCGTRSLEDAVKTFKLAIECQRTKGSNDSAMGKLFLKLGWLYRYMDKPEHENKNLEMALNHLSRFYDSGVSEDGPKEEMNLMFLLGQLNRKLGYEKEAVNWYIRITQHPDKKSYPYIVNRARDEWQVIRNVLKT